MDPPGLGACDGPSFSWCGLGCCLVEDDESEVAQGGEVVGCVPGVGLVVVFLHAHVLLPVESVFDLPVVANGLSRLRWCQLACGGVGDGIGAFVGDEPGAMVHALALDVEELADARESCCGWIFGVDGEGGEGTPVGATMGMADAGVVGT